MKRKTSRAEPTDCGTDELARRFAVRPELAGVGHSVRVRVTDEEEIDRLLLGGMLSLKEHEIAVDWLRDLWRARMTGMGAVNLETTTTSDPFRVFHPEAMLKLVEMFREIDRSLGAIARNLSVCVLVNGHTFNRSDPWWRTDLELFRASLIAYREFADRWHAERQGA